ncbi:MAG: HIT family protein [Pseudomonadota bacterium]
MTLNATYDPDNIFAKIIRGDMPCVKILETDATLAFMDVFPQSEGHCLIIHKQATAANLFDIDTGALSEITASTQTVARAVKDGLSPDGIRIMQFNGAPAGQSVYHLHFHVIPVYEGVSLGAHASGGPVEASTLEPIAEKIRAAL